MNYSKLNIGLDEPFEMVDTNEVIKSAIKKLAPQIKSNQATVNGSNLPNVFFNKTQLSQVFCNLITNALIFRSEQSPIVDIYWTEDEEFIHFHIKDNGIGIDPKFHEKIFVVFQRLHNREKYTGSGLGLSTCKKIIEQHGGSISVSSRAGKGATFSFSILKENHAQGKSKSIRPSQKKHNGVLVS